MYLLSDLKLIPTFEAHACKQQIHLKNKQNYTIGLRTYFLPLNFYS